MNLVIIGFDNDLSPNRRQAIFETNDDLSLNEHRGTNLSEIWISFFNIFIEENAFENVICEVASNLSRPQCLKNRSGGRFKNTYELLNLRALKFSYANKIHIFQCMAQCMGEIFCVEFQRYPLNFHTKYLTHTLKDMIFIQHGNFKSS